MPKAPLLFASATQGSGIDRMLDTVMKVCYSQLPVVNLLVYKLILPLTRLDGSAVWVLQVFGERYRRIKTHELNDILRELRIRHPMPAKRGKRLRIKFVTQTAVNIPTFVFFVNDAQLVTTEFQRFLSNLIRERYGFVGTPIRILFRGSKSESSAPRPRDASRDAKPSK